MINLRYDLFFTDDERVAKYVARGLNEEQARHTRAIDDLPSRLMRAFEKRREPERIIYLFYKTGQRQFSTLPAIPYASPTPKPF